MNKTTHLALLLSIALLSACASTRAPDAALYDFGPLKTVPANASPLAPVSIAEPRTPAWLDGAQMIYRLAYANGQQASSYANSRWAMPPAQLFVERLKSRIAQTGGTVLPASDGALNVPVLRIEMSDFSQSFDAPNHSTVQISVRASLFQGRNLIGQKNFFKQVDAPGADAPAGAKALADGSDVLIGGMIAWLATLPSSPQAAK
jgi:cholesterol transport system auxiliary component